MIGAHGDGDESRPIFVAKHDSAGSFLCLCQGRRHAGHDVEVAGEQRIESRRIRRIAAVDDERAGVGLWGAPVVPVSCENAPASGREGLKLERTGSDRLIPVRRAVLDDVRRLGEGELRKLCDASEQRDFNRQLV